MVDAYARRLNEVWAEWWEARAQIPRAMRANSHMRKRAKRPMCLRSCEEDERQVEVDGDSGCGAGAKGRGTEVGSSPMALNSPGILRSTAPRSEERRCGAPEGGDQSDSAHTLLGSMRVCGDGTRSKHRRPTTVRRSDCVRPTDLEPPLARTLSALSPILKSFEPLEPCLF